MAVTLVDKLGDDLTIVNSARVSFAKSSIPEMDWDQFKRDDPDLYAYLQRRSSLTPALVVSIARYLGYGRINAGDKRLLRFLARNRHATPFEHVVFQFHIECGIDEAREWQRHRIASYNEVSTRYVEVAPTFVLPEHYQITEQFGKPGDYHFGPVEDVEKVKWARERLQFAYDTGYQVYSELVAAGIAKEVARKALSLAKVTEFYVTANLRSWFNFMSLRNAPTAMEFIRDDAAEIERLITTRVPAAMEAWVAENRLPI